MGRQGLELILVHFDNRPYTSDAEVDKALDLMKRLDKALGRTSKKIIVPHGRSQTELSRNCKRNMSCVLCRRMMFRVGERLAAKTGAGCLVTGESMGQVASQTLTNIYVEERATRLPVLRPVIGFDKVEIERIAKEIGTYEISTRPGLCCTIAPEQTIDLQQARCRGGGGEQGGHRAARGGRGGRRQGDRVRDRT